MELHQIYGSVRRDRPHPDRMLEYVVYLLYRAVFAILTALPLPFLALVGQAGGTFAWALSPKYRGLAFRNVTIAFGEGKSVSERRRLVRRHFQRLGVDILGGLKLAAMPLEKTRTHVEIENADAAHRELRAGRPVVFILSHLGNWELQAQMFPATIGYVRNSTVFQPLRNRYIDRHFRKLRGRAGVELFNRDEGFDQAIALLRGGGAVGILSDQHAGDHGMWVPFFDKLASTTSLPALLAKRTGAALIGTAVYTDSPGRWRIVFTEKINQPGDSVELLTAKMNDLIANQIRRAPEDWFWVHDRWKTPRPEFSSRSLQTWRVRAERKRIVTTVPNLNSLEQLARRLGHERSGGAGNQGRAAGRARHDCGAGENCVDLEIGSGG